MGGFPTVNFGQAESGLFSPEEIARLMESEVRRSVRYGYPLVVLVAEIDRLESLHDLYGVDSEQRIVQAVAAMLRSSTRASDVMGALRARRLRIVLPHTSRDGAVAIARRLLTGCRELEFRGDGRVLRASLSIGLAARAEEENLARLTEHAEQALAAAQAAGGDRFQEYEVLPRRANPAAPRAAVPAGLPARAREPAPPLPALEELTGSTPEEKALSLLRLAGIEDRSGAIEREVLAILRRAVQEARGPRASRDEVREEMRVLEAHIAEQKRMLEASEEELARLLREKSAEPGVASVYRTVQGLDPGDRDYARKKEMLAVIYRANVELLRQLERQAGAG
jgi:diguanylate cyclase (GGDEF)-like protein